MSLILDAMVTLLTNFMRYSFNYVTSKNHVDVVRVRVHALTVPMPLKLKLNCVQRTTGRSILHAT